MWLGNLPLSEQYPGLYYIVHRKHDIVANIMSTTPLNISFPRALLGNKLVARHDLVAKIANISLNDQIDSFRYGYKQKIDNLQYNLCIEFLLTMLRWLKTLLFWRLKIPLKVKIFIWLLHKGVILTKDNLIRRRW